MEETVQVTHFLGEESGDVPPTPGEVRFRSPETALIRWPAPPIPEQTFMVKHSDTEPRLASGMPEDRQSADVLLPLVYQQLRQLARKRLSGERPGQTLQPTALVHEAFLRLGRQEEPLWDNRWHFYGAAAEAMRRILIEKARRSQRARHGGGQIKVTLGDDVGRAAGSGQLDIELLALNRALDRLEIKDPRMAKVVKLRYFAGLTVSETARALDLAPRTVNRYWTAARSWLHLEVAGQAPGKRQS